MTLVFAMALRLAAIKGGSADTGGGRGDQDSTDLDTHTGSEVADKNSNAGMGAAKAAAKRNLCLRKQCRLSGAFLVLEEDDPTRPHDVVVPVG
jgi:hypothetical protein